MMNRIHTKLAAMFAAALFLGGASPTSSTMPMVMAESIALPPTMAVPKRLEPVFAPAPMPDLNQEAGSQHRAEPAKVELTPTLFRHHSTYAGDGWTPNSDVESAQYKNPHPAPSLSLSVPLQ